ncbi:hypothetical protein ACNF42_05735 [Cuniculiplasma sp. SKW3]|uniref:hypothetical protein n=1 Tax=Cuniculiplasma sp. SKW3 TaxID=3400170 RepID=UPI003FD318A7
MKYGNAIKIASFAVVILFIVMSGAAFTKGTVVDERNHGAERVFLRDMSALKDYKYHY